MISLRKGFVTQKLYNYIIFAS